MQSRKYLDETSTSPIEYKSVKLPQILIKEGPIGVIPTHQGDNAEGAKGIFYNNSSIEQIIPFINAVDIDWNGAVVASGKEINTTTDLLNWIKDSQAVNSEFLGIFDNPPQENKSILIYENGEWDYTVYKDQLIEITYEDLVLLKRSRKLEPGRQYRITNYVTRVKGEQIYTSKEYPFDIIVIADNVNTLNENARVIQHINDTHFSNNNLKAWIIKYSIDNNSSKYDWASSNGKGVIYYMKDEFGNEAGYDFKNIVFNDIFTFNYEYHEGEESDSSDSSDSDIISSAEQTPSDIEEIIDESTDSYDDNILDIINLDASLYPRCYNNVIEPYVDSLGKQYLNYNVILDAEYCSDVIIKANCQHIKIQEGSHILIQEGNRHITIINPCQNVFIENRSKPLCDVPLMTTGNRPADGGNLIIEANDYEAFIRRKKNRASRFRYDAEK